MSLAWRMFEELCDVANDFERLRDHYPPGSNGWTALVDLIAALDGLIDYLVCSDGLEEECPENVDESTSC